MLQLQNPTFYKILPRIYLLYHFIFHISECKFELLLLMVMFEYN